MKAGFIAGMEPMAEDIVNARDIAALKRKDKLFSRIAERYGDPPNWHTKAGLRLALPYHPRAANQHRFREGAFRKLEVLSDKLYPEAILELSDEEMRLCQISRQKASYLRALAEAVIEKRLVFRNSGDRTWA